MNVFERSLYSMNKFLQTVESADLQKIIDEVSEMKFEGPTLEAYFKSLTHRTNIYFTFQPGVEPHIFNSPPDLCNFSQEFDQTPKFPLESFFLRNIAKWNK